jgi:uncharacterized protein (DUF58 family)
MPGLGERLRLLFGRDASRWASLAPKAEVADPFGADFEQKLEMLAQLSRRSQSELFGVARRDKRRGSGVEFADFRDYTTGDDFRFVDPHAAMRFDKLYVREYEEEEDQSIDILIDASSSMGQAGREKLDLAKRLAAAIAYVGLTNLARVTVVALYESKLLRHPTTRGKGQFLSIMRFVREIEPSGTTSLESVLRRFARQQRRRGIAVLLSDLYDPEGFERGLSVLRYERFQPQLLHILDERDTLAATRGDVTLVDCETGVEFQATVTPALLARLKGAQRSLVERVQRHCRSHGVGYHSSEVSIPFERIIQQLLGREGRARS